LEPFLCAQAYASLWEATSELGPYLVGSCYFLSAGLTLIAGGLSIVGAVLLRGRDLGDIGPEAEAGRAYRPTYRLTEKEFLARWYVPPMMGSGNRRDGDDHADGPPITMEEKGGAMARNENPGDKEIDKTEQEEGAGGSSKY
jgi:hypothetical protein